MKIDVHAHLTHARYASTVLPFFENDNSPTAGDIRRILKGVAGSSSMTSVEERLKYMEQMQIDTQVLSISIPNVYVPDKAAAVDICQMANDSLIEVANQYPQRFRVFASLPVHFPDEAVRELNRIGGRDEVAGIVLGARVAGMMLDNPIIRPIYGELERRGLPFLMHPMGALGAECMLDFNLTGLVGYLYETSTSAIRLVLAGVFEQHPNLQMIFPHLGGVAPYFLGRVQNGYEHQPIVRQNISAPPIEYFKRFYYDTVCRNVPAMKMALEMFGIEHILFGTDYPFRADTLEQLRDIADLHLSQDDAEAVYWRNAASLLGLKVGPSGLVAGS